MKTGRILIPTLFMLAVMTSACGKTPSAYQGDFVDAVNGVKLTLTSDKGTFTDSSGRVIESKAVSLEFKDLAEGKPGIYMKANDEHPDQIELFWILPSLASRQEQQSFVWMQSEILYTRMNAKSRSGDTVSEITMSHCTDGMLMLDLPTQTWNGGCPADHKTYTLKRSAKK